MRVCSACITISEGKTIGLTESSFDVGRIAFTTIDSAAGTKKASFKIVNLPEGDAMTIGVANPHDYKDKNFEISLGIFGII